MPSLGWDRAYRSGYLVGMYDEEGLVFVGRADEQIKIGGRRIELGEDPQCPAGAPGWSPPRQRRSCTTEAGNHILVGYVATEPTFDLVAALTRAARSECPRRWSLVLPGRPPCPRAPQARSTAIPCRGPLPGIDASSRTRAISRGRNALALKSLWLYLLGAVVTSPADDFFVLGGGSLSAAQLVGRLREKFPEVTVADVYENPSVAGLASTLDTHVQRAGEAELAPYDRCARRRRRRRSS